MIIANISVQFIALAITLLLLACNLLDQIPQGRAGDFINDMFIANALLLCCGIASWAMEGVASLGILNTVLTAATSAMSFVLAIFFTYYLKYSVFLEPVTSSPRLIRLVVVLAYCGIGLNILSIFNHMFFYYVDGVYHTGPFFWLDALFAFIILLPIMAYLIKQRRLLGRRTLLVLLSYGFLPMVAAALQPVFPELDLLCLASTLSLLILYITVYIDRGRALAREDQELAESQMSVMLSQIQPHFLYNTLSVIQDMCHDKSPEAEDATVEFSEFLRGNIDSIQATRPIAFTQELKHTRNYLALANRRFGDLLHVDYDIQTTDFLLPPLTLQPLVENAVRYGVMERAEGGTVLIRTSQTDTASTVAVIDDGVGFDINTPKADGRTHIGISNVAQRIKTMCGGNLTITSVAGTGTSAVITLPKGDDSYEDHGRG
jgi:two-component system LytT family sensor kinase